MKLNKQYKLLIFANNFMVINIIDIIKYLVFNTSNY